MITLPKDCTICTWPPESKGGQHVGSSYGVKVENETLGLTVIVNNGRSRFKNTLVAIDMMLAGITNEHTR